MSVWNVPEDAVIKPGDGESMLDGITISYWGEAGNPVEVYL